MRIATGATSDSMTPCFAEIYCCMLLAQVVREEQGDAVVDNPPEAPHQTHLFSTFHVTKPYFRAIARSEAELHIEGPEYWCVCVCLLV